MCWHPGVPPGSKQGAMQPIEEPTTSTFKFFHVPRAVHSQDAVKRRPALTAKNLPNNGALKGLRLLQGAHLLSSSIAPA